MSDDSHRTPPELLTGPFLILFAAHFFFGLAFWPYVLLPVFLQDLGANLAVVGLIMGAAPLSGILARPWVGSALDRAGRKRCLMIGGVVFLAANLLYLQVDALGLPIYAVRLLHGLGVGVLTATFFTLAADLSPDTRITEGIALFGVSGHLSGAIGVTMGEEILRMGGFSALFWTTSVLSLLSILLSLKIPEPAHHFHEPPRGNFLRVSFTPSLRKPLVVTLGFAVGLASYMVFLKPYVRSVGIDSVSGFFLAYTLTAVAVRLIGGNWPERFGLRRVAFHSTLSLGVGIVLLILFPTAGGLLVAGVFCGIGHGFLYPILAVMVVGAARTADRGTRMAVFTMLFDIGQFIGPPVLGWIGKGGHFIAIFAVAAGIQVANLIALAVYKRPVTDERRHESL